MLFDEVQKFLVIEFTPSDPLLIIQSSIPAITHLRVEPLYLAGYLFEPCIFVLAKRQQHLVLLLAPRLFGLLVPLLDQILFS